MHIEESFWMVCPQFCKSVTFLRYIKNDNPSHWCQRMQILTWYLHCGRCCVVVFWQSMIVICLMVSLPSMSLAWRGSCLVDQLYHCYCCDLSLSKIIITSHLTTSSLLTYHDLLPHLQVQMWNPGIEETVLVAHWVMNDVDRCQVVFISYHLVKHGVSFDGALAQVTEVYSVDDKKVCKSFWVCKGRFCFRGLKHDKQFRAGV